MMPRRVHVVTARPDERQMLVSYLDASGFRAVGWRGAEALGEALADAAPDLLLLDAELTGADPIAMIRAVRDRQPELGLIVLSASDDPTLGARALDAGADDWMLRPFDRREVLARLRSVLRRLRPADPPARETRVRIGRFVCDTGCGALLDAPDRPDLAACESALLGTFVANPHRPLEPGFLARVAHIPDTPDASNVARQIDSLRRKLERDPARPAAIRDIAGIGYMFVPDPD